MSSDTSRSAVMTFSTPPGRPTSSAISAIRYPAPGASGETFTITVHPASSAGATLIRMSGSGAFHGMIAPTTPTGSRTRRPNPPPASDVALGEKASSNG